MESAIESKKLQKLLLGENKKRGTNIVMFGFEITPNGIPFPNAWKDRPTRSTTMEHVEIRYCFTFFVKYE